jgi:hypothetical protein
MHIEWLLNPVTVYALASAGLTLSLGLFVGVKREMAKARHTAKQAQRLRDAEQLVVRSLETELVSLRESLNQLEAVPPGRPAGMGINLTKRAQALRMHRRGEQVPSIAAALETPVNEIALLLKVHALTGEVQKKAS